MAKFEWHHVIPLCFDGLHYLPKGEILSSNLVALFPSVHKELHRTLDIEYRLIREFRKQHAWKIEKDKAYFEDMFHLLDHYFAKLHRLPELHKLHADSLQSQCIVLKNIFKSPVGVPLTATFVDDLERFKYYMEIYKKIFLKRIS